MRTAERGLQQSHAEPASSPLSSQSPSRPEGVAAPVSTQASGRLGSRCGFPLLSDLSPTYQGNFPTGRVQQPPAYRAIDHVKAFLEACK